MLPVISLTGVTIYTYPLILGIVWGVSFHLSKLMIERYELKIPHFNLLFFWVFAMSWLGAKLLYLITLDSEKMMSAGLHSSFWMGGGFVFYGGAIFGIFATVIYSKFFKVSLREFSFIIPILALCHGLGRIACFLAGCCYGSHSELPWAIKLHGIHRHPVQLYESFSLLFLSWFLFKKYDEGKSPLLLYFMTYPIIRFGLEFIRGDKIRGVDLILGLSTSQIISALIFSISLILVLRKKEL